MARFFRAAFAKRPAEELYDLEKDAAQLTNVAGLREYGDAQRELRSELDRWMRKTDDPRAKGRDDRWDRYPYFGRLQGRVLQK